MLSAITVAFVYLAIESALLVLSLYDGSLENIKNMLNAMYTFAFEVKRISIEKYLKKKFEVHFWSMKSKCWNRNIKIC